MWPNGETPGGERTTRVYNTLRDQLAAGTYPPGARLPGHLRLARDFRVAPMTVRQVLGRLEADGLVERRPGRGTFIRARPVQTSAAVVDQYVAAAVAGDQSTALALVAAATAGQSAVEVYLELLQPAQRRVGACWAAGQLGVAEERLATGIAEQAMALLRQRLPRAVPNGRRALVACVEGERHALGARVMADFLLMGGFEVAFLGADVPLDSLEDLVRRRPPDLLVLSATTPSGADQAQRAITPLRWAAPGMCLAVGGQGVDPYSPAEGGPPPFGADLYGADAAATLGRALAAFDLPPVL